MDHMGGDFLEDEHIEHRLLLVLSWPKVESKIQVGQYLLAEEKKEKNE